MEADQERVISEHLLPHLPVYEILSTLRIYQDVQGEFLKRIENAFPAGNSAFVALREDSHALQRYLPLFQQELLRRHGVNETDFFANGVFLPELLPTLRPDLAVLLQKDLFNTDMDVLLEHVSGKIDDNWRAEVAQLLDLRRQIHDWRAIIWDVMGEFDLPARPELFRTCHGPVFLLGGPLLRRGSLRGRARRRACPRP